MPEVRITATAAAQATQLDAWWAEHRPLAPDLFAREFANAVALLGVAPGVGARFQRSSLPGVRRIVLQRTRNLLFYVFDRKTDTVHILAVWGGPKGHDPALEKP
jgi:hypothetical protein